MAYFMDLINSMNKIYRKAFDFDEGQMDNEQRRIRTMISLWPMEGPRKPPTRAITDKLGALYKSQAAIRHVWLGLVAVNPHQNSHNRTHSTAPSLIYILGFHQSAMSHVRR